MNQVTKNTDKNKVACDGGTTSSHPRVWLQIEPATGEVVCPYCETKFIKNGENSDHH